MKHKTTTLSLITSALLLVGGTAQAGHLGGYELFYPLALIGGMLAAGLMAWIVGLLTLRLRHDYLAIATFGVAVAFENLMRNAEWLAGGAKGLRGFERPLRAALGDGFLYNLLFFAVVLLILIATYLFLERLVASPFGRLLRAIRPGNAPSIAITRSMAAKSTKRIKSAKISSIYLFFRCCDKAAPPVQMTQRTPVSAQRAVRSKQTYQARH